MLRSPFFRRLFIPYLILIGAATTAVGLFAARALRDAYTQRQQRALHDATILVGQLLAPQLSADVDAKELAAFVHAIATRIQCRLTIMRADGVVIADSEADPAHMENHRLRPEFDQAARTGEGIDTRPSNTLRNETLVYLARQVRDVRDNPILGPDRQPCYVRLAVHMNALQQQLGQLYAGVASATAVALSAAGLLSFLFAQRVARPMVHLTQFADAISRGDLHRRTVSPERAGEITTLASSLNTMAESLQRLLEQTAKDKAELLAILSSMSEGVIATDSAQRILLVNDAAARLFGFDPAATGAFLWERLRNEQILKAATEVLGGAQRKLISVGPLAGRHLDVTLCTFEAHRGSGGLIVVAHDITQSFQYQELRKEFVANVSHELRTPLTLIKGFVETLQDGAWRDGHKAQEYLAVISRHTDQLTNLVRDLLELSRIESQGLLPGRNPVEIGLVLRRAYESLLPAAQRKHQTFTIEVPATLPTIKGNADYLERAVTNLIDNASKYTPENGAITLRSRCDDKTVVIEVQDNGIGIPASDIPRIFERFYRVDRSRSREMGGTGLGLSIVKHVAQVHGGTVDVESEPGRGSTFRLKIPRE